MLYLLKMFKFRVVFEQHLEKFVFPAEVKENQTSKLLSVTDYTS